MCAFLRPSPQVEETIVALIDPDFIFLKPLTTWLSPTETVVKGDGLSLEGLKLENGGWVRKGYPAGVATCVSTVVVGCSFVSCFCVSCRDILPRPI